jgi:hypothetical protein
LAIDLQPSKTDISEKENLRLHSALMNMPLQMLYSLAEKYDIEIPFEALDSYSIVDGFLNELDSDERKEILSKYGDAGKVSTFVFVTREITPSIEAVYAKAKMLLDIKPESLSWESYPYFDEVETDYVNRVLKIRFHYLLGAFPYFDETTGKPNVHRRFWRGVVVYRPKSKFLEIRTKHGSISRTLSARIAVHLGLEPFYSVDLINEKTNKKFVEWISSLNTATIELPISEVSGSLIISARKGMDLRTAKRYNEELRYGRLRHGHVTIKGKNDEKINFHIHFKNCHIIYTLLTSEADIEYVINALERICEGGTFERPEKLLTEYFRKQS